MHSDNLAIYGRKDKADESDTRNLALDGVRGIAALIVVFWHLAVNFFPCAAWGIEKPTSLSWEILLHRSPLWVLLNGNFAVCLFFVMSGYFLTIGYFRFRDASPLIRRIVGRPLRLGILPCASIIAIWFASRTSPDAVTNLLVPVLKATGAFDAVSPYLNLTPDLTFRALLENILWLPWFQTPDFKRLFNGVLWTMHVELLGSFLAMTLAIILAQAKSRWLTAGGYTVVAVILIFSLADYGFYFATFLCGSAIAAIDPAISKAKSWKRLVPIIIAILGLFLGGYNDAGLTGSPTPVVPVFSSSITSDTAAIVSLGAVLFFYGVLISSDLSKLFSMPVFLFFGRVSFSMYVFHTLVIFVVGINLFLLLGPTISIGSRSMIAAAASLFTSIGFAAILTSWIDAPAIKLARSFAKAVLR